MGKLYRNKNSGSFYSHTFENPNVVQKYDSGQVQSDDTVFLGYTRGSVQMDLSYSPVGFWKLDGDLTDSSGNGNDLIYVGNGDPEQKFVHGPSPNRKAIRLHNGSFLYADAAVLEITGALTVQATYLLPDHEVSQVGFFAQHLSGSGASSGNNLYSLYTIKPNQSVGQAMNFRYAHENVAGGPEGVELSASFAYSYKWHHIALTRKIDGGGNSSIKLYIDGRLLATGSVGSAPTGGASSLFTIGGAIDAGDNPESVATNALRGSVCDVKVHNIALNHIQIKAEAERSTGYSIMDGYYEIVPTEVDPPTSEEYRDTE